MKKITLLFTIIFCLLITMPQFTSTIAEEVVSGPIESVEELPEVSLTGEEDEMNEDQTQNNGIEVEDEPSFVEYDYTVDLSNLYAYSIVALNDANITQHIRGSIWIGGTLTGNQYIDDGSIQGQAASDSYVYNNMSQLYFRGRTAEQSQDYYFLLTYKSVESTRNYWLKLMEDLPNGDETFIYLKPDSNGYVDACLWKYHSDGSDEEKHSIKKVYWTDATSIAVGGLDGHLIAPFADVAVISSNNCGSIVGWNVDIEGEEHINYYIPTYPQPVEKVTPTPTPPTTIVVHKKVIGSMWHVRCDIMDTTSFEAGGGKWKRDVISNPGGSTSKEGHRSNKCGNDSHWVIWVNNEGQPYRMDEVKSGATGGTLPTIVYKPRYNLTSEEIQNMTAEDAELVYKYSQNFIDPMPWTDIKIGERLYWTTTNEGQIWYHSGIPYESAPNFMLFIDGVGYPIVAGGSVEVSDLEPGIHEITETSSDNYYLGTVTAINGTITSIGEWTIEISIEDGAQVEVDWPNVVVTPEPTSSPTPPPTPSITPTPTPSPTPTPTPSPTPTLTPTPSPTPTVTPRVTPEIIRPTPHPHIIPPTGESDFIVPLSLFIISLIGIGIYFMAKKH